MGNLRLISGEDLFFRDHYDFGAKSGPPIFSISQNGPRLKKVGHPWLSDSRLFLWSDRLKCQTLTTSHSNIESGGGLCNFLQW